MSRPRGSPNSPVGDNHLGSTSGPSLLCQGFGRADHSVTTEKLKAEYPDYEITWADEGY